MLVARTVAAPLLVVFTSAMGVMAVTTLPVEVEPSLLAAFGSVDVAVLDTTLVREPLAGAVTVTVKLVIAPRVNSASAGHQTVPLPLVPPLEALTKATFVGNRSLTTTLVASFGPRFVIVMV